MSPAPGPEPLVIIPCFNEERSLPGLLDELDEVAPGCPRVVVDDGSSDRSAAVARGRAAVLSLSSNLGIGGAVQTGIRFAAEEGLGSCVQLDGDGQHPPAAIALLTAAMRETGADLVIGSRFLESSEGFRSTAARRIGIGLITLAIRLLFGTRITDPTSGLRLMGPAAIAAFAARYPLDFPEPVSVGMALGRGLKVVEVPVEMRARSHGQSSIGGIGSLLYMLRVIGNLVLVRIGG